MGWKDRFTFRDKRYAECSVQGELFRFYPNRISLLAEAAQLSTPVARAVSVLFADESRDSKSSVRRTRDDQFYVEDITTEAITEEMAAYRQAERDRAIATILNVLSDARNRITLGRLIMDSLREEFEYKPDRSVAEVEAFLYGQKDDPDYTGLDMPVLVQLFSGWMRGNAQVFGEMGEKVVRLVRQRLEGLQESRSEESTPSLTNGEPSKTPTSERSEQDSLPTS